MKLPELRAIIVDDEAPARERLQELLTVHSHVTVVGEANSVANAATLCADLQPNLLFLDVQLEDEISFALLPKLAPVPAIIFVTAYVEFAIRAFEVNAIDYLLKPISPERLADSLQRIIHQPQPVFTEKLKENDQIYLNSTRHRMVYVTEISGIEAEDNYSLVRLTNGNSCMIRRSMTEWEKALPKGIFLRPHRSLILNIQAVEKILMTRRSEIEFEVAGFPKPILLGRRAAARVKRALRRPNLL